MPDAHDPYAALRRRDFALLLASNVLAATSAEVQFTVAEWEIFRRTNSEAMLGYGGLAQFLPLLLLALPAGQAADWFSRKYLLMLAHFTMASASFGLALVSLYDGPVWLIFVFLALAGVSRALGMPARSSLIPLVVGPGMLGNAVTWSVSGWQVAAVSGPAVGGLLAGTPGMAFCGTIAGLLICIGMVAFIYPRETANSSPAEGGGSPVEARSARALLAGIRFVWRTDLLLAAITLDLFAVFLGGSVALLPAFAKKILDVDEVGFGILRAAPAIGAFVMAMAMAHRRPLARPGLALLGSVALFGFATIGFGLSENVYLSFAMLFLIGAFDNISVVIRGTLMQMLTPDSMRGRVAAVNSVFISSTNQLGAFESGITAAWLGLVPAVVAGGAGTLVVVVAAALWWPRLRRLEPLHELKAES
ncbi:MAG: MFS transporter [Planctomycetes bacterium]|nr:MFS transporter [Planctomycetota bacterium]